jgi:hypothetical protein
MSLPASVLSTMRTMPDGRVSQTFLTLAELPGNQFRFVATYHRDFHDDRAEKFSWVWDAASDGCRSTVIKCIAIFAGCPGIRFNYDDAAEVCAFIRAVGRTIDVKQYARYRDEFRM